MIFKEFYMITRLRFFLTLATLSTLFLSFSCSRSTNSSDVLVTDVTHSQVKRQSIGNCWLYAVASWVESEHLAATDEEINTSESYWTWWHFYNVLVGSSGTTLSTGGTFSVARSIILNHGYLLEGEFLLGEATSQMSTAQKRAETYIESQLQPGGALESSAQRTPANVKTQLDLAFGSNMAQAEQLAHPASSLIVGNVNGSSISLESLLLASSTNRWTTTSYPRLYGQNAVEDANTSARRHSLLQRVLHAINDHHPVVMSIMIDFNALDITDATFKRSTLEQSGGLGRQGGHMVVLEDYVVDNVPGVGTIGEGDVSPELKQLALQGNLRYLKAKNSWGTNRPERGLIDGYTRFNWDYINGQLAWKADGEDPNSSVSYYTTLTDFTLPAGY